MLVIGTKPEYFNAVWVKNEWSRFLKIMKNDRARMLIPCYRDMDAYELPEEFAHLQAQDMSKIGFISDLVRGIKKVIVKEKEKEIVKEKIVVQQSTGGTSVNAQIQRGNIALEDHEWDKADEFFEEALNLDPQCAEAYIGKLMAKYKKVNIDSLTQYYISKYESSRTETLEACPEKTEHIEDMVSQCMVLGYLSDSEIRNQYEFDRTYSAKWSIRIQQKSKEMSELAGEKLLVRARQYASGDTKAKIDKMMEEIEDELGKRISDAQSSDNAAIAEIKSKYDEFISEIDIKVQGLYDKAVEIRESTYNARVAMMNNAHSIDELEQARDLLANMHGYADTAELARKCQAEIDRLKEEKKIAVEKETKRAAESRKKTIIISGVLVTIAIIACLVISMVVIPNIKYNNAVNLMNEAKYEEAITAFELMKGYKDSEDQISECKYNIAANLMKDEKYEDAITGFEALGGYKDSEDQISECKYNIAVNLMKDEKYEDAITGFEALGGYKDSEDQISECKYNIAVNLMKEEKYGEAVTAFEALNGDKDSNTMIKECEKKFTEMLKKAKNGDVVHIGNYNNNTEWIILDKQKDKMLVISEYVICQMAYNTENRDTTWENCTLRSWLNGEYLTSAFSAVEQKLIISTTNENKYNSDYGTNGGNDTEDKVFLLSVGEVKKYFLTDTQSIASIGSFGTSWWWLRSPGSLSSNAAYVSSTGTVIEAGNGVSNADGAVRPAMWIDISD